MIDKHAANGLVHTGSWKVHIGNVQNQYVHIWMYKNFPHLDEFIGGSGKDNSMNDKLNNHIVKRSNQICLSFSYFGVYKRKENYSFVVNGSTL